MLPHRSTLLLAALLPIMGCYTHGKFVDQFSEEVCTLYDECGVIEAYGHTDLESCTSLTTEGMDGEDNLCDAYDSEAAKACVWGIREMDCQDLSDQSFPEGCSTACTLTQ